MWAPAIWIRTPMLDPARTDPKHRLGPVFRTRNTIETRILGDRGRFRRFCPILDPSPGKKDPETGPGKKDPGKKDPDCEDTVKTKKTLDSYGLRFLSLHQIENKPARKRYDDD